MTTALQNEVMGDTIDSVVSVAQALGLFAKVNGHEPKAAPGTRMTCAVWVQSLYPAPAQSGLSATTGRLVLNVRIYQNFRSEPEDSIDPDVTRAASLLMGVYLSDLDLDTPGVWTIDPHGMAGIQAGIEAGYLEQDGAMFRTLTLTLPLLIADLWPQTN